MDTHPVRMSHPLFDDQDAEIANIYVTQYNTISGCRVGDWVDFPNDVSHRIALLTSETAYTTDSSNFYLDSSGVRSSGLLYRPIPLNILILTGQSRMARVWFYHHEMELQYNDIYTHVPFRVYTCPALVLSYVDLNMCSG